MPWYKTGTVSITNGQTSVTGVGTNFASNARVGDGFRGPDGAWYEVVNIASQTVLGIFPAYAGATVSASANYMVAPIQGYNKDTADQLRAITGGVLDGKQNTNTNLTALSNLAGDLTDRLIYFSSPTAMNTSPLTAKARSLLLRSNSETMRSEIGAASAGANSDITSISGLTSMLPINQGGTGSGNLLGAQQNLGIVKVTSNTDTTIGSIPVVGWMGYGGVTSPRLPNASANQLLATGQYAATATWEGSPFVGTNPNNQGTLSVIVWDGPTFTTQIFYPLRYANGPVRYRNNYAGTWGAWSILLTVDDITKDPVAGGIMQSTVSGSYTINKYANGQMCVQGQIPSPVTTTVAANSTTQINITLPVSFVDIATSNVQITLSSPGLTHDHYGIFSPNLDVANRILGFFRNGATAQTMGPLRVIVWGKWK